MSDGAQTNLTTLAKTNFSRFARRTQRSMKMNEYRHHISGFFARHRDAEKTLSKLAEQGLPRDRLNIFTAESLQPAFSQEKKSDGVLQDVLVDGAVGTMVGTGIGALLEVGLVVANVSLFIASPLIAPLMLMGWGASIGALIGASTGAAEGAGHKHGWLADLVRDAIASGQVVLVAETRTEQETATARRVIQASVNSCEDVNMAPA